MLFLKKKNGAWLEKIEKIITKIGNWLVFNDYSIIFLLNRLARDIFGKWDVLVKRYIILVKRDNWCFSWKDNYLIINNIIIIK